MTDNQNKETYHQKRKRIAKHDKEILRQREEQKPKLSPPKSYSKYYLTESGSLLPNKFTGWPPYPEADWDERD